MGLYNRQYIHWDLEIGDLICFTKSPFNEKVADSIFEIVGISEDGWSADLRVFKSSYLEEGFIYVNQPTRGFKKVKSYPLNDKQEYK
jgi:hypothetical protein